jgi:hypothetical protein
MVSRRALALRALAARRLGLGTRFSRLAFARRLAARLRAPRPALAFMPALLRNVALRRPYFD